MIPGYAAGQVVSTDQGPTPIERVCHGAKVLSRIGLKKVLVADVSEGAALAIRCSDGRTIVCDTNALIWTRARLWTAAWQLSSDDVLLCSDGSNVTVSSVKEAPRSAMHSLSLPRDAGYFCGGILVR